MPHTIIYKIALSFLTCIFFVKNLPAQDTETKFSKNALKYSVGAAISDNREFNGAGLLFSAGYQRNVWKDRIRFNPNFSFGYFNANWISDLPYQWHNSLTLQALMHGDLIRYKAFAITLCAGPILNNTRGLLGTGGYPPGRTRSDYLSLWHTGMFFSGGLRINPPKSSVAFELIPFAIQADHQYHFEGGIKLGIDVKLR